MHIETLDPSDSGHLWIFAGPDGGIGKTLETSEYIDNKEAIFQGDEFLLTGFHRQREKEIESLIRKFGGHVLSQVPLFSLDKRKNMTDFPSWKPPIVLSPRKVCCSISSHILGVLYLLPIFKGHRGRVSHLKFSLLRMRNSNCSSNKRLQQHAIEAGIGERHINTVFFIIYINL
jgi:hypothetical protein